MESKNRNKTNKLATSVNKNVLRSNNKKLMSTERAERFLDTQEEFWESLAIRQERSEKKYEQKEE